LKTIEIRSDEPYVWFVVFTDGDGAFWWQRLLKPGFRHCFVVRAEGKKTMMISHKGFRLSVDMLKMYCADFVQAQVMGGYTVVRYQYQPIPKPTYRSIMTCVSVVINAIGITGILALTPYSLYRALISRQAKRVEVSV